MPRHTTITDKQILDAAREVFLTDGFGARTSDIAARAGVSEGSIFKRYPSKEALFFAALDIRHPPPWYSLVEPEHAIPDAKEHLRSLAIGIVNEFAEMIPRIIAVAGKRPFGPEHDPMRDMPDPPPLRDTNAVRAFLERLVAEGQIRPCDTLHVAQALLGSLSQYPMMAILTRQELDRDSLRDFASDLVDLLWDGIAPARS
jgi:AcrR family transcriptional regulator